LDPQQGQQARQSGDVLAVDFHQRQRARRFGVYRRMHGFHQRRFAGAARAPQ